MLCLLKAKADINALANGLTPLHASVEGSQITVTGTLLLGPQSKRPGSEPREPLEELLLFGPGTRVAFPQGPQALRLLDDAQAG